MRVVRVLVLAAALAIGLAACSWWPSAQPDLTPEGRVFALQGEFNILLDQLNAYAAQPFCTDTVVVACADAGIVVRFPELAGKAVAALNAAEAAVRLGGADSAALASAARVALAELSRTLLEARR